MKRCKSAPGLLQISLANPPVNKNIRRYGTLPATLLKRTDMSLVLSSPFGTSTTNMKRRNKASIVTPAMRVKVEHPPAHLSRETAAVTTVNEKEDELDAQPSTLLLSDATKLSTSSLNSSTTTDNKTLTTNSPPVSTPMKGAMSRDLISDDISTSMRDASLIGGGGAVCGQLGNMMPPSYNERLLLGEVEKLKKFVYYLKAENLTLNFKLNRYRQHIGEIDMDVENTKAKPESSDIDDFKV